MFQIGILNIENLFFNNIISLLDKGFKFIPCNHLNTFNMFKFILESFDSNFNLFNSRLNLNLRNYEKSRSFRLLNSTEPEVFNIKIPFGLVECFYDKCKKLNKSFNKLKFPTSNESLSFKFNFYKALCDLTFENNFNISRSEFYYMKKFKDGNFFKIIECDKNIGVCFIDTAIYNQYAIQHLNKKENYVKLNKDPLNDVILTIENKLNDLFQNKHISKKIFSKLNNKNSKLGSFRLLV